MVWLKSGRLSIGLPKTARPDPAQDSSLVDLVVLQWLWDVLSFRDAPHEVWGEGGRLAHLETRVAGSCLRSQGLRSQGAHPGPFLWAKKALRAQPPDHAHSGVCAGRPSRGRLSEAPIAPCQLVPEPGLSPCLRADRSRAQGFPSVCPPRWDAMPPLNSTCRES